MPAAKLPRPEKPRTRTGGGQGLANATPRVWAGANLASHETLQLEKGLERLTAMPEAHRPFWSLARVAFLQVRAELAARPFTAFN